MSEAVVSILARGKKPADTLEPLVNVIAEALAIDPLMVAHYGRIMRREDVLPGPDGEVGPSHAVLLLLAVMAAIRPLDASVAALAYRDLPALAAFPLAYLRAADGKSTALPKGTFIDALVGMIAAQADSGALPARIIVSRQLRRPCATIAWISAPSVKLPGGVAKPTATVWTFAHSSDAMDDQIGMSVSATCPGQVLQRLGGFFAGRAQAKPDAGAPRFAHRGTPLAGDTASDTLPAVGTFGANDAEAFPNSEAPPPNTAAAAPDESANVLRLHMNHRGPDAA